MSLVPLHFPFPLVFRQKIFRCAVLALLCAGLSSCGSSNLTPVATQPPPVQTTKTNYLSNPEFSDWDAAASLPSNWKGQFLGSSPVQQGAKGVEWTVNWPGANLLSQSVHVPAHQFYMASVKVRYDLHNYSSGGLYVMDASMHNVIAKNDRILSSGNETFEVLFNAGSQQDFVIVLGFLNGMNASVHYESASLVQHPFDSRIGTASFAKYLNHERNLQFDAAHFDESIQQVSDFVNESLLCDSIYHEVECKQRSAEILAMLGDGPDYLNYKGNLKAGQLILLGYCQRSSLSVAEVLQHEFGISTRQIHMVIGGIGQHQFFDYWNPFAQRWVTVDPYFSVTFQDANGLKGTDKIVAGDLPAQFLRFGNHPFTYDSDFLADEWKTMDGIVVSRSFSLTYPFAPGQELIPIE